MFTTQSTRAEQVSQNTTPPSNRTQRTETSPNVNPPQERQVQQALNTHLRRFPSTENLRAHYLPSLQSLNPIAESSKFLPSEESKQIIDSLTGWQKLENGPIGPNYFPDKNVRVALERMFLTQASVEEPVINALALQKAKAQNIQNLILNKPPVAAETFKQDTILFTTELRQRMKRLNQFLVKEGVSPEARALFNRYVAVTAPTMQVMAFPDAVAHAADVAQLTYLQAKQHGANEQQAVQALLVGWLHDPKLPGSVSWSNLATHPLVGSSIAAHTLKQPELQEALSSYLKQSSSQRQEFIDGITEALSINNDSKWVLDNVILHKVSFHPLAEPGIADLPESGAVTKTDVEALMNQRFLAPSKGEELPPVPEAMQSALKQVKLSTDLRGIRYEALPEDYKNQVSRESFANLLEGKAERQEEWAKAQKAVKEASPQVIVNPKVNGLSLTSHHSEVKNAELAALGLAIADPLLLSPHKVIAQTMGNTLLTRIQSYTSSFENNLKYLPKSAQADGLSWRNHVYLGMIQAADTLTGNQTSANLTPASDGEELLALVNRAETWQGSKGDFSALNPGNQPEAFQELLMHLKKNYESSVKRELMKSSTVSVLQQPSALQRRMSSIVPALPQPSTLQRRMSANLPSTNDSSNRHSRVRVEPSVLDQ